MPKREYKITNTRFIWTIKNLVFSGKEIETIFDSEQEKINAITVAHAKLKEIGISHGARDCETYREERGYNNFKAPIPNPDFNDIQNFLTNSKGVFIFNDNDGIIKSNNNIYTISIVKSIFLPLFQASENINKQNENSLLILTGFYYTKYYLLGFFHGVTKYLRMYFKDGSYFVGGDIECFFSGIINNNLIFTIYFCTNGAIQNADIPYSKFITQSSSKEPLKIFNTRFVWTLKYCLHFLAAVNKLSTTNFELLKKLAFSHGCRDCQTYRIEKLNETIINIPSVELDFIKIKNYLIEIGVFTLDVEESDIATVFYNLKVKESIFLWKITEPTEDLFNILNQKNDENFNDFQHFQEIMNHENKNMNWIGFIYSIFYLNGFFYGLRIGLNRDPLSGFYLLIDDQVIYCYYKGFKNEHLLFSIGAVLPPDAIQDFDNTVLNN